MNGTRKRSWTDQIIVAAIFALLGIAALSFFVLFVEPTDRRHRAPFEANYSDQALVNALSGEHLDQTLSAIARAGAPEGAREQGRLSGSPGFYNTEKLILERFRDAGLEVQTQEFRVVVPVTETCELVDEAGAPIPGVTLYPFQPNGLTTVALPTNGISGEMVVMESTDLRYLTGHDPEQTIAVTYLDSAGGWMKLASLGVKAVIVVEDEAAKKLRTDPDARGVWEGLINVNEVRYPRFLARGPVTELAGRRGISRPGFVLC